MSDLSAPVSANTSPEVIRAREIAAEWGLAPMQFERLLHDRALDIETARPLISLAHYLDRAYPGQPEKQVAWLSTPNSTFDQNKPIDVMMSSPEALGWVVYCLESAMRFKNSTSDADSKSAADH